MSNQYDIIVVGSGPGGEGAAIKAAKEGKRVAVIERYPRVGGGATHLATIPSKALRHSIQQVIESRRLNDADYQGLLQSTAGVIDEQVAVLWGQLSNYVIALVAGHVDRIIGAMAL